MPRALSSEHYETVGRADRDRCLSASHWRLRPAILRWMHGRGTAHGERGRHDSTGGPSNPGRGESWRACRVDGDTVAGPDEPGGSKQESSTAEGIAIFPGHHRSARSGPRRLHQHPSSSRGPRTGLGLLARRSGRVPARLGWPSAGQANAQDLIRGCVHQCQDGRVYPGRVRWIDWMTRASLA